MTNSNHLLYLGIQKFNSKKYYEAHDILEELYFQSQGTNKLFIQGLIQLAVSFYHLERNNYVGSKKLLVRAIDKLNISKLNYNNINIDNLLAFAKELNQNDNLNSQDLKKVPSIIIID